MQLMVITAFNIFGRNGDDWLVPRMRMFKELALPSALAQTDQDYTWLILVDSESPVPFIEELKTLLPPFAVVQEVEKATINQTYRGDGEGAISTLAEPVNHMPRIAGPHIKDKWVASTNCSVDDAIAVDFIEKVKTVACEREEVIVFPEGALKMDAGIPHKDGYYRVITDSFFCVVVEQAKNFQSVIGGGCHCRNMKRTRIQTEDPMWLWHLHGVLQNCSPSSNFRFLGVKKPYTYEEVKRRFNYEGSIQRFKQTK